MVNAYNALYFLTDGGEVIIDQADDWARFAAISFDINRGQFVFSARRCNDDGITGYISELPPGNHFT